MRGYDAVRIDAFPIPFWTPYLYGGIEGEEVARKSPRLVAWMRDRSR